MVNNIYQKSNTYVLQNVDAKNLRNTFKPALSFKNGVLDRDITSFSGKQDKVSFNGKLLLAEDTNKALFKKDLQALIKDNNTSAQALQELVSRLYPAYSIKIVDLENHPISALRDSKEIVITQENYTGVKPVSTFYVNLGALNNNGSQVIVNQTVEAFYTAIAQFAEVNEIASRMESFIDKIIASVHQHGKVEFEPVKDLIFETIKEQDPKHYNDGKPPLELTILKPGELEKGILNTACLIINVKEDNTLHETVDINWLYKKDDHLIEEISHEVTHGLQDLTDIFSNEGNFNAVVKNSLPEEDFRRIVYSKQVLERSLHKVLYTIINEEEIRTTSVRPKPNDADMQKFRDVFPKLLIDYVANCKQEDAKESLEFLLFIVKAEVQAYKMGITAYKKFKELDNKYIANDLLPLAYQAFTNYLEPRVVNFESTEKLLREEKAELRVITKRLNKEANVKKPPKKGKKPQTRKQKLRAMLRG